VSPSRRRRRRTHSSVTGGKSWRARQYSVSLGTDHVAKGRPRSAGLERATSTRSRSWLARRIAGRPRGFDVCSKVRKPVALNQRTQSYATVKWSAASTMLPLAHKLVVRETSFKPSSEGTPSLHDLYSALAADEKRNRVIVGDVMQALEQRRSPIILTERKEHLEHLAGRVTNFARRLIVLQGGMSAKERRRAGEQLAAISDSEERLVLATGRYLGEGFDDVRLDTLFLALPVSWKGTLIQYTGRLHRLHPGKLPLLDLPLPTPLPAGAEWIEAYRQWRGKG